MHRVLGRHLEHRLQAILGRGILPQCDVNGRPHPANNALRTTRMGAHRSTNDCGQLAKCKTIDRSLSFPLSLSTYISPRHNERYTTEGRRSCRLGISVGIGIHGSSNPSRLPDKPARHPYTPHLMKHEALARRARVETNPPGRERLVRHLGLYHRSFLVVQRR